MRLGVFGWAAVAATAILLLAGMAVHRPFVARFGGTSMSGSAVSSPAGVGPAPRVRFEPIVNGFAAPVDIQFVPGRPGQAIVLEKAGRARFIELPSQGAPNVLANAAPAEAVDVVALEVRSHSELGLLGLAFHPHYAENGLFYLNDNPRDVGPLRTRISEWQLPRDQLGRQAAKLLRVLLEIEQPYSNHDGGQVAFGADGYLYIGMGDGGSRADPQNNGQNLGSLLGKMLRIDVDAQPGYAIPPDNPFVNRPGARPEIWAYGLRNPWRFSFDPQQRLIAADVGQDSYEEIDIVAAGDNLGWKTREAAHCFSPAEGCASEGMVDPIFEYERPSGSSVTGGYVYLGKLLPWLEQKYVFADHVSGLVWALELPETAGLGRAEELGRFPHAISAFGRDAEGELYALDLTRGLLLRLAPL